MKQTNSIKPAYYPFFSNDEEYNRFIEEMTTLAEEGELPLLMEYNKPKDLDLDMITQFSIKFREDADLDARFHFYTCENCNRLHCLMTVNYLENDEEDEE